MCKPLISEGVKTNNILLKVTVPKMVGRKRKRDSSEPSGCVADLAAIQSEASDKTPLKRGEAGYLKRSMQDNVGRYNIEPIGIIDYTHRFRGWCSYISQLSKRLTRLGLSDFQYSTANSEFMKKMRDSVLSYDCVFAPRCST